MLGRSFSFDPTKGEHIAYPAKADVTEIWHKRLGHYHIQRMLKLTEKDMKKGLPGFADYLPSYSACQFGKQHSLFLNQPGELYKSFSLYILML